MRALILAALLLPLSARAQTSCVAWRCDPDNWRNSDMNWENSPDNWRNNPDNWNNSPYNYATAGRGIYDSDGNRIGYAVREPSGVTNYYDDMGARMGYTPGGK